MPFDLQTRLLRVLSDGHFYRVGGHNPVKTNVRVIAATHQNLEQRVADGSFREDLFHRLNVIRLRLPALRERCEDIAMLTRHFLLQSARQLGVDPKRISNSAIERLERFSFPGNVRQLENMCHWLTVMAPAQMIEMKDLPPEVSLSAPTMTPIEGIAAAAAKATAESIASSPPGNLCDVDPPASHALAPEPVGAGTLLPSDWESALEAEIQALLASGRRDVWDVLSRRFEARLIRAALASTHGRRIEAAHKLGIGRNTITRKIQDLGLE